MSSAGPSSAVQTGADRLVASVRRLAGRRGRGRRYALLGHGASITSDARPLHLALARAGVVPAVLFGPEHGYYGVEQDMVASRDARDPWTGAPILSLYGDDVSSLKPRPEAFADLDLLIIDLQDIGSRYYTYAATAVWATEAALQAGLEVWVLDRPNPLGGEVIEGHRLGEGFTSFVGAFAGLPVRHGLTLGELVRLLLGAPDGLEIWTMEGWRRSMRFADTGLPWIAPSPNMPTLATAEIYPGGCLIEATELSEGRGTTRPFHLVGAPGLDPPALADHLAGLDLPGAAFVPTYFKPQFQKHAGEVCGGVEILVQDGARLRSYRLFLELLVTVRELLGDAFTWREKPYEFVADIPAIDLLTGGDAYRLALASSADSRPALDAWLADLESEERAFRETRRPILLYPETSPS